MSSTSSLQVLTVSELNRQAKRLLEGQLSLVWIEGEISDFTHHSSGHMYFALKDDRSQISVVMFAGTNAALPFRPANGQKVLARGSVTLYEPRGQYQLVAQNMYPAGAGELWLQFEALKEQLRGEGLFDAERKRPLPGFPRRIGVITSPTGAAVHDIINVVARRAPQVTLVVRPTLVQGEGAPADLVAALQEFEEWGAVELVIIARGGGSLEDLWAFNTEELVRAVAECTLPIVSAVGHETDITLCDLVADVRAPTPSAAAELVAVEREGYLQYLDERLLTLDAALERVLRDLRRQLEQVRQRHVFQQPLVNISLQRERLSGQLSRWGLLVRHTFGNHQELLRVPEARLAALDPRRVLERGYALVTDGATGQLVTRREQLRLKQPLGVTFADGSARVKVTELPEE